MIHLLRKIHLWYAISILSIIWITFLPLYYLFSRSPKMYGVLNSFRTIHCFTATFLSGIILDFSYQQPLEAGKTYIYCANHTSMLDIVLFCVLAKGRYHFMGKDELAHIPIVKIFFNTIDIPVDRDSKISSFKAFKKAKENLNNGMSLIIFPEGKIGNEYPPLLHPFKTGPFRLAIESKIDIVPVSIANLWEILWSEGERGSKPGKVKVFIHKPIVSGIFTPENEAALKQQVYAAINSKIRYEY